MTTTIAPPRLPQEEPAEGGPAGTGGERAPASTPPAHPDVPRRLSARTSDDYASLAGSAVSALGLVWVLFSQVLPWSGFVGFVVCWWLVFLAIYAAVSTVGNPR